MLEGIVAFKEGKGSIDSWILYDRLELELLKGLCSFLVSGRLFTMQIETVQGIGFTCFSTHVVSPIDTTPMVPNGLIMLHSDNWLEDWLVESPDEKFIKETIFSFPYAEYWFSHAVLNSPASIRLRGGFSLKFEIKEWETIRRFELVQTKSHQAVVTITSDQEKSLREILELHEGLLLLFRFCSMLWLPPLQRLSFAVMTVGLIRVNFCIIFHCLLPRITQMRTIT